MRGSIQINNISERKVPITVKKPKIIRMLAAKNMSSAINALKRSGPVVGKLRTIAVMVSPEKMAGSIQPMVLTIGLIAILTGYLNKRALSSTPLARAVMTYCFLSSSNKQPRITRMSPAVPAVPMTIKGKEGEEPPQEIRKIFNLADEWLNVAYGTEKYVKLANELITLNVKGFYLIGMVESSPRPVIRKNGLRNARREGGQFRPGLGAYMTDQWFFEK